MKKQKYNVIDAYDLAKEMIKVYVERGDTIQELKSGRMGCTLGDHDGFGSIGSLYGQKERNTDYIVIVFGNKQEFDFRLKDMFNDIKSKQLTLF